jgi:reactive intermediate/imine deaminase
MKVNIEHFNPQTLAKPGGHYSHAVVANGFIFISGQLPITKEGQKLSQASFKDQTLQVLENLKCALEGAGGNIQSLVQVRVYVDDINNWPEFNVIYSEWAGDSLPARAVVPTGQLQFGLKIEVEAIAAKL